MGKEWYCQECKQWINLGNEDRGGVKLEHKRMHQKQRDLFWGHPDLQELDFTLDSWYTEG